MSNIKINDVPQRIQYSATGGQTQFTIPFPFFSNSYVYVWLNGIQILQGGAPGQYVVTGAGSPSGGLVTFNTAATLNDIVTIEGIMPIDRTSIYSATISNLTGSDLNGDFNREVVMLQQLNTTQSFMQLQYAPWTEISQDLTVTTDRYIPLLPAGYGWRKNMAGTAIEAIAIPDGGFAPQVGSFVTVSDERSDLPNSFPLFDLGNASTGGMGIPAGTTAQRVVPTAPNIGLRFNTDLSIIEVYIGGVWVEIPSSAAGLFLPLVGGTMSGVIDMDSNAIENLPAPTNPNDAVRKAYADLFLPLAGGTMSGAIDMGAELINNLLDPVSAQDAATKNYVDTVVGGAAGGVGGNIQWNDAGAFGGDPNFNTDGSGNVTITGSLVVDNLSFDGNRISATTGLVELEDAQLFNDMDADSNKIINLLAPTAGTDAANKAYVDSVAAGFFFLEPVRVASTANFTSTYNNGTSGVGATLTATVNGAASIDGVSLSLNDRVLFKDQTTTYQNGIYYVSQVGSGGTPAIYTRALDYDEPSDIDPGDMATVLQGTANASTFWVETAIVTTIGTDPITFTQFGVSSSNVVTLTGTQTISGVKTFSNGFRLANTGILDTNGVAILDFNAVASAVNNLRLQNNIATGSPVMSAVGSDTNIGFQIDSKGTAGVYIKGQQTGLTPAGYRGEVISASVLAASAVAFTTATARNITSISLTAGNWLVFGIVSFAGSSNVQTQVISWCSTTSATLPDNSIRSGMTVATATTQFNFNTAPLFLNLAATTTVYLSGYTAFASGSVGGSGYIVGVRL